MLLDGFDLKIQNIPYFDQSVAYGHLFGGGAEIHFECIAVDLSASITFRFDLL
jgi:hypothetical protein